MAVFSWLLCGGTEGTGLLQTKRRRIKTVMRELIYRAGRLIEHGRQVVLGLGADDRAAAVSMRLHVHFAATAWLRRWTSTARHPVSSARLGNLHPEQRRRGLGLLGSCCLEALALQLACKSDAMARSRSQFMRTTHRLAG